MFDSKEKKQEKKNMKAQEVMAEYGLDALQGDDRALMESILTNGFLINNAKVLTALSGGTVQQVANGLLADTLKTNLMLIRQNNEIISLLKQIAEK